MKKSHLIGTLLAAAGMSFAVAAVAHGVQVPANSTELQIFKNAQRMPIKSMNEPGVNAYFEDVVGSSDPKAPIACGLFKIEKGNPLVYTYTYDDTKIILDGHIFFSDGKRKVKGEPGDVLFFPKGATITFSTDASGLAYACGQRKVDTE